MTSQQPMNAGQELNNGYVLPPRLQQINQVQTAGGQQTQTLNPNSQVTASPMSHTRSPSFLSFFKSKQPTDPQRSMHQKALSSSPNNQSLSNDLVRGQTPVGQLAPHNTPQQSPHNTMISPKPPSQSGQQTPPPNQPTQMQVQGQAQRPGPPPTQPSQMQVQRPGPQPQQPSQPVVQTVPPQQNAASQPASPALHPEIRSVMQLNMAHAHKIYCSGPLIRRIERLPDGTAPSKDEGWVDIWAQLGGTTLSMWDMRDIQEASKQGREVPPSYINITDAFVRIIGALTVPATDTTPSKRYSNVLTVNNAGSNLFLFSCQTTASVISWAAAFRLAAWEKARLEEIYTAHLIRITLTARDVPTTLVRGKIEGWARVRIAGQTDWKKFWVVVQEGAEGIDHVPTGTERANGAAGSATLVKKNRMSSIFSSKDSPPASSLPPKPIISMFLSPKPKDRRKPALSISSVTQAYAMYPDRPELISKSTLIKVEGTFGDEETAAALRLREGWASIMPELENNTGQAAEILKWVVALHDAFGLYGRPGAWTWDPRETISLMFGYPVGPQRETLFLDREIAEKMDPREERTSHLRTELKKLLQQHVRPPVQVVQNPQVNSQMTGTPSLPPIGGINTNGALPPLPPDGSTQASGSQLPPLSTAPNGSGNVAWQRPLTPIAEGGSVVTHGRSNSDVFFANQSPSTSSPLHGEAGPSTSVLGGPISQNPPSGLMEPSVPLQSASSPPTPIIAPVIPALPLFSRSPQAPRTPPVSNPVPVGAQQFDGVKKHVGQGSLVNLADQAGSGATQSITPPAVASSVSKALATQKFQTQETPPFVPRQPVPATSIPPVADPSSSTSTKPFIHDVAPSVSLSSSQDDLMDQPGALYYIQQQDESSSSALLGTSNIPTPQKQRAIQPDFEDYSEDDKSSLNIAAPIPKDPAGLNPYAGIHDSSDTGIDIDQAPPIRRGTPMSFTEASSMSTGSAGPIVKPLQVGRMSPNRSGLGRKPSGARELNTSRVYRPESFSSPTSTEPEPIESESKMDEAHPDQLQNQDDVNAVLSYLSIAETDVAGPSSSSTVMMTQSMPGEIEPTGAQVAHDNSASIPAVLVQAPAGPAGDSLPYKSSFAPSNKAAERKAKAQAQMEAQLAAAHKPGRANGKRKSRIAGAWESSEDEDEEEEEEEEVNSDGEVLNNAKGLQSISSHQNLSSSAVSGRSIQQPVANDSQQEVSPSQLRPSRNLPQIPGARNSDMQQQPPRRIPSDQYTEGARRTYYEEAAPSRRIPSDHYTEGARRTYHEEAAPSRRIPSDQYTEGARRTYHEEAAPQFKTQAEVPVPGPTRQVWSQVLDPGRPVGRPQQEQSRETFVQLEASETMTKPFAAQGLLSAGLQDKEDRSAKRQEEHARETGASLINVPSKPPPPQSGLLGYVTAHEKERGRSGGLGATLTEREREKRVAEERQRRFDEHQRLQLDQVQQGMSMYGAPFGYNPMMNPMMMNMMGMNPMMAGGGLSPMMTGGGMAQMNPMMSGFPGMMGGFSPQHMFAAQQAAQAYQHAMMAFSVAGSQVGGEGGAAAAGGNTGGAVVVPQPTNGVQNVTSAGLGVMNPAMTGSMGGFDPRMSMFGMGMMNMGMGVPPSMGGQIPVGAHITGMSNFDPRASPGPGNASPSNVNNNDLGLQPPAQLPQFSSRTSSPAGRGSPRIVVLGEQQPERGPPLHTPSPK